MIGLIVIGSVLYMASNNEKVAVTNDSFTRFDDSFKRCASLFNIDWLILKAICMNESSLGLHPSVAHGLIHPTDIQGSISEDGKSWGLMQFTIPTARDFDKGATEEKLNNADYSIRLGAQFVAWLYARFPVTDPRRTEWVIKSYNQGIGNTNKERNGLIAGYAQEYFERFKRNYKTAKEKAA